MAYRPLDIATKKLVLQQAGPDFLQSIGCLVGDPIFLEHLVKHKILLSWEAQDITDVLKTSQKAGQLLTLLRQCSVRQFVDFCLVLHGVANRADIIRDVFKLNIDHIREQKVSMTRKEYPIWDKRNVNQQSELQHTEYQQLLQEARVTLRRYLRLSQILPHLQQLGVVHEEDSGSHSPKSTAVTKLLDYLQLSPTWKFHCLMRACALTGHKHIIEKVGLNPHDYTRAEDREDPLQYSAQPQTPSNEPELDGRPQQPHTSGQHPVHPAYRQPAQIYGLPSDVIRIIRDHCGSYKETLMRRNLYDFDDCPSAKVIDLAKIYVSVGAQCEGEDGGFKEISENEIFKLQPGDTSLCLIRLYGPPGAGKSAIAAHIAYTWSLEFLKRLDQPTQMHLDDEHLTALVYIPAREITGTVEEAIKDHLGCRPEDKEVLYKHVVTGDGTAVVIEGLDEVRDEKVLRNIEKYIQERRSTAGGPQVLVTSRTDMCNIGSKFFDRFLVVEGFTVEQAFEYIEAYLQGETKENVLQYAQEHQDRLYPVLTNPLRLHVFCTLIQRGELTLENSHDLSIYKLLVLLEQCLLNREKKEVTKEQLQEFYKMSMHGLLKGWRVFSEDNLAQFKIAEACHVFFSKKVTTTAAGTHVTYSFPHEMLHEYFAGRYIESLSLQSKKALILSISSNPAFRNLQRIVFETISHQEQDQNELLQTMLRAILIIQHQDSVEDKPTGLFQRWFTLYGKLVDLHRQIIPPQSLDLSMLDVQSGKQVEKIWKIIKQSFDDNSVGLQKARWYLGLRDGVFGHVAECLQACTPDQRAKLTKTTTAQLLPCQYQDKKGRRFVCGVGESRWAEVTFNKANNDIAVNAWTAADATEALHHAGLSALPTGESHTFGTLTVYTNKFRDLWGQPPSSSPTSPQDSKYSEELQHWSSMCERFRLPCSSEMSHNAEVVLHPRSGKISVQAKDMEVAMEALCQVRLSATDFCQPGTFNSMTINVDKPGYINATEEKNALEREFEQWFILCKSCQFICVAGTARWWEMVHEYDRIYVRAWSIEDAKEALMQARMSSTPPQGRHTIGNILFYINNNWGVWGRPPSSAFSPQACNSLNAELANWSDICWESHYVCSVGAGRLSQVSYTPDTDTIYSNTITVGAWCVADVQQALQQYRAAAASPHVRGVKMFDLDITRYQSVWGQPPTSTSTPHLWEELHTELQHWAPRCRQDYDYSIDLCRTTPLQHLLQSAMRPRLSWVWYGSIDMEALYSLVHAGDLTHVYRLYDTQIVVPSGGDRAALRDMRQQLLQAKGAGGYKLLGDPHFVTQTGERYTW